jgi:hypothetical protein
MIQRTHLTVLVAAALVASIGLSAPAAAAEPAPSEHRRGCTGEYVFAATYAVTDMSVPPALKVPLVPVAFVMDLALLPFEVVADCL